MAKAKKYKTIETSREKVYEVESGQFVGFIISEVKK